MQVLQRLINTIHAQMRGLNSTTKLLIGSLMIIVAMTLFLVALYAGKPSMAVLPVELTGDNRERVLSHLQSGGIDFDERADGLYVPADRKYTVLARLHENRLINSGQIDFATLIEQDSPFRSRHQNQQRAMIAKMSVLGTMIEAMDDVSRAKVLIDQPEGVPGIGRANIKPEASVTVTPRGNEINQAMVDAIANLVASSVAGMPAANVTVVDARAGRSMRARTEEDLSSHRHLEIKEAHEVYLRRKLREALVHIPGAVVSVNVIPDTTSEVLHRRGFDEPMLGVARESMRNLMSSARGSSGEPGVMPNAGMSISGGGGGQQMSDEQSETQMVPRFPEETSRRSDPKGYAQVINTTIGVPKSYFVRLFQHEQDDAEARPDAAELDDVYDRYADRIREYVRPLIVAGADGAQPGTVVVNMVHDFDDVVPASGAGIASPASGGGWSAGGVDDAVKYVGLGSLALVSLVMMFLMVRKANTREELPTAQELVGVPPALQVDESEMVGEADEDSPALEGIELDDEALRHQQMLDQINEMISSDPNEAAGLMRRWMKAEH